MKNQIKLLKNTWKIVALSVFTLFAFTGFAQNKNTVELKVKTSAVCDMCKTTIERELAFTKGVKKSELDVPSKVVTVVYNPNKTTPEKIRLAISMAGYDADDVPAEPKAYEKLHACCKKDVVH
jgi:periplasmic mercuric ion binding protein